VTRKAESPPDAMTAAPPASAEATSLEGILQLEPLPRVDPAGLLYAPLLSWLVARVRPALTVEAGPGEWASLLSTCDAVRKLGPEARCVAVRLASSGNADDGDTPAFRRLLAECAKRLGYAVTGYDTEAESLDALAGGPLVDLLHVTLLDREDIALPDFDTWFDRMAPGGTIVVTSTAADVSSAFGEATRLVSARYPSARVSLGLTTEALVAQAPVDGAAPTVELLRDVPTSEGTFLDILRGAVEPLEHLDESTSPVALRAVLARWMEGQHAEREALLAALRAYQDLTTHLSVDASEAHRQLAAHVESARLEREHIVKEFLDRLDVLSAKISTSAARSAAQLEDRDRLLEELEQRMLAYAGQAATAQSVIDDLKQSSSWRVTAPLRLMSRLAARRRAPNETAR